MLCIVQISPNKDNLRYLCQKIKTVYDFLPILRSLQKQRTSFERTIIYCQRQIDCGTLYQLFAKILGPEFTELPGTLASLLEYCLVDCFSKGTQQEVKDNILRQFTQHTVLRVIICPAAFGMGVDCVGVTRVIFQKAQSHTSTVFGQFS